MSEFEVTIDEGTKQGLIWMNVGKKVVFIVAKFHKHKI